jgi:hypothetical protein
VIVIIQYFGVKYACEMAGEINKLLRAINKPATLPAVILEIVFLKIKTAFYDTFSIFIFLPKQ